MTPLNGRLCLDRSISARIGFAEWLNAHGLTGHAMEIGVWRGYFAFPFLERWHGSSMTLVDPWMKLPDEEYQDIRNTHFDEGAYAHVCEQALRFKPRCTVIRSDSQGAVPLIPPGVRFDFIYIDANHAYQHVLQDMRLWWTRLAPRSVLAGHDIFSLLHPGVTQAVLEFAAEVDATVYIVDGDYNENGRQDNAPSWYLKKGW